MFIHKKQITIVGLLVLSMMNSSQATENHSIIPKENIEVVEKLSLERQRVTYQALQKILQQPEIVSLVPAEKLVEMLKGYPLYAYARYDLLVQQLKLAKLQNNQQVLLLAKKLEAFQTQFPTFNPLKLNNLRQQFYLALQKKQAWQALLMLETLLPAKSISSQCAWLEAKLQTIATLPAKQRQAQIIQAKLWQKVEKLWLMGQSQPVICDPIFEQWQADKQLTSSLLWQRAVLAFQQRNSGLLRYLVNLNNTKKNVVVSKTKTDKHLKPVVSKLLPQLQNLLKKPTEFPTFIQTLSTKTVKNTPHLHQVLQVAYTNFLKALPETDVDKAKLLLSPNISRKLALTKGEQQLWLKQLVMRFFDNTQPQWQKWRDYQLIRLHNDSLIERRIRLALRQKQPIGHWLNRLSATTKKKDEWLYWQAVLLAKDKSKESQYRAKEILLALSNKRGFYPMLATEQLERDYRPKFRELDEQELARINLTGFQVELEKIRELIYFNDLNDAMYEWSRLLRNANFQQKLALSYYANQQQWYGLAVEATIQAKAWDHLRLRLPLAYPQLFDLYLKNRKIHRTFAMAIARQESGWRPNVRSGANAYGLMQLLPSTAKATAKYFKLPYSEKTAQLFEPATNIMLGTAHLDQLYQIYGDNRILIAAAYNAGRSRVDQWLEKAGGRLSMAEFVASIPFYETRHYVQNVLAYDYYYQLLYQARAKKFSKAELDRLY